MQDAGNDMNLVKELIEGNESAFNKLFYKYSRWIFQTVVFRCNGNRQEAQDVVQEVFFKLWQVRHKLNPELSIKYLLFTMMNNICKDGNEKRQTSLKNNIKYLEKQEIICESDNNESNEINEKFHKAISQISAPKTRQVITMYYMDCLNYDQIIRITGMKLQTIRNYVSEGLAILRKSLKN